MSTVSRFSLPGEDVHLWPRHQSDLGIGRVGGVGLVLHVHEEAHVFLEGAVSIFGDPRAHRGGHWNFLCCEIIKTLFVLYFTITSKKWKVHK